jgi:hypothetical protein
MNISCPSSVGGSATNCFVNRCGVFASSARTVSRSGTNVSPYPAGVAVVVACAAVISIRIYQQPEHVQVAGESSPVPTRSPNTEKESDFAPPALIPIPTFNGGPTLLPGSRDIPLLPADLLRSDEFVPFKPEWESLDDQPLLEK